MSSPTRQQIVKGCRCTSGKYRGVSTFDAKNPNLRGFRWYRLPKSSDIPEALAITQDDDRTDIPNYFTLPRTTCRYRFSKCG